MPKSDTQFKPGQVANPKGRGTNSEGLRGYLLLKFGKDAHELIDEAYRIAFAEKTPDKTRLEAIKLLLAYHSGQPLKSMELVGQDGSPIGPITFVIRERDKQEPA